MGKTTWFTCCLKCTDETLEQLHKDRMEYGYTAITGSQWYDLVECGPGAHMFYRRSLKRRLLTWFSEQYLFKCDRCGRHRKHGFEFYLFRQRTVKQQSKMEADYTKRMNKLFESAVPLDRKSNIPEQHSQQMEQ